MLTKQTLRCACRPLRARARLPPRSYNKTFISAVDADLDEEPNSHFKKLLGVIDRIEALGVGMDNSALIDDARDHVKRSIVAIEGCCAGANANSASIAKSKESTSLGGMVH